MAGRDPGGVGAACWRFLFVVFVDHSDWTSHMALSLEWHLKRSRTRSRSAGGGRRRRRRPAADTGGNNGGVDVRLEALREALSRPKFRPFLSSMAVLARPEEVDAAWVALWDLPEIAILPLESPVDP